MSASIVRVCSSKPLVDSNTVLLFKAISNMSCLTSFKSYLTPRNSHEFTVRIKEANSQRGRNYHFHFVLLCSAEGTWQGCLPRDEYIYSPFATQCLSVPWKAAEKFTLYFNCCHYRWGNEREVQSLRDDRMSGLRGQSRCLWRSSPEVYMSYVCNGCKRCGRIVSFCSFEGISNDFIFFLILESNARIKFYLNIQLLFQRKFQKGK